MREAEDGGVEGRERQDGTDGGMTYLYVDRVAQNAMLASNAVSFIFHKMPRAVSYLGFLLIIIISGSNLKFGNFGKPNIFISTFPDAELRLVQRDFPPAAFYLERGATMASGLPFKVSPYKSILAFLFFIGQLSVPHTDHLCYLSLSLYPGVSSLSDLRPLSIV